MKLHWGKAIFIFFTIFIGLNITFIIFSLNQDIELVEDDYYEQGANYTDHMKIQERSAPYNDSINITNEIKKLLVNIPSSIYQQTDSLDFFFYNPSTKSKDYKILVSSLSDTVYIEKQPIKPGHYTIKIKWQLAKNNYLVEKIIDIN